MLKTTKNYFDSVCFDPEALAQKLGFKNADMLKKSPYILKGYKWMIENEYDHKVYNICGLLLSIMDSIKSKHEIAIIEKKIIAAIGMSKKMSEKLKQYKAERKKKLYGKR